ncbi:unnamed protein product [Euphydryas editha]|uniref:Transposable element Tc3 transposase n=1 Tax=Euphydryas editha TaxID=104508 RepID=A0AAU9U2G6_EUPED|nr:unnamed protein product [Euphydryas editha]
MFETTGSTVPIMSHGRPVSARRADIVEQVRRSVRKNPQQSTRKRSQTLDIKRSTLRRILKRDLHLKAYKIQLVQELKPQDANNRLSFANQMLDLFTNFNNVMFSDEAIFHLNGHVNKQNCRFWSETNPQRLHERPLRSPKLVVCAAISSTGIVGPYFFEDERGRAMMVRANNYCDMIREFLVPALQEVQGNTSRIWFQQDGATCHTAKVSISLLKNIFPGKLISKGGDIEWPSRSPDLSPCDFFLWGYLKSVVYENNPNNLELKRHIYEINNIPRITFRRVFQNLRVRFQECQAAEGRHSDNIIFKS